NAQVYPGLFSPARPNPLNRNSYQFFETLAVQKNICLLWILGKTLEKEGTYDEPFCDYGGSEHGRGTDDWLNDGFGLGRNPLL
ncbi:MAG: hypothetical protein WCH61_08935, partial [bacterium]